MLTAETQQVRYLRRRLAMLLRGIRVYGPTEYYLRDYKRTFDKLTELQGE